MLENEEYKLLLKDDWKKIVINDIKKFLKGEIEELHYNILDFNSIFTIFKDVFKADKELLNDFSCNGYDFDYWLHVRIDGYKDISVTGNGMYANCIIQWKDDLD